ncbi:MAG: hypothetical protein ACLUFI_06975 [Oscillospiraceae bacterium]
MEVTPYRMTPDVIRSVVQKHRPGVYILGDDDDGRFTFRYVGRSDHCLQTRLLTHGLLYHCPLFLIFSCTDTAKDAFELESKWWHDCKNNGVHLLNIIHPDSPAGMMLSLSLLPVQERDQGTASSSEGKLTRQLYKQKRG